MFTYHYREVTSFITQLPSKDAVKINDIVEAVKHKLAAMGYVVDERPRVQIVKRGHAIEVTVEVKGDSCVAPF